MSNRINRDNRTLLYSLDPINLPPPPPRLLVDLMRWNSSYNNNDYPGQNIINQALLKKALPGDRVTNSAEINDWNNIIKRFGVSEV